MNGAVFYLMTPVEGFNATVTLPELHAADKSVQREMGLNAARALSALGAVDYQAVGLHDFGKPEGFLERQVGRWLSELDSYSALDGYPGPDIPGLDDVARWLDEHRQATWRPGIRHGDYHLANLMHSYARLDGEPGPGGGAGPGRRRAHRGRRGAGPGVPHRRRGAHVLQALHRPGGLERPRVRRQGAPGAGRHAPLDHPRPVPPRPGVHRR